MGKRRCYKNKVYLIPEELRKELNLFLLDGKKSLKELRDLINSYPDNYVEISYSGLNRYAKVFDKEMKDKADIDYLLNNLPDNFSFNQESKIYKFITQMTQNKMLTSMLGKEDFTAKDISHYARAIKDIASSAKDMEKIKEQIEKELREQGLQKIEETGKAEGLTEQTISNLKKALSS